MKKIINWGFIGLGNASYNLAKEFVNIDNSNLKAVASLQEKKRELFKDQFKLKEKNVFSNYNEVINHPDIDIVYIGLPNSMHETYCFKSLDSNKHVLVEKPVTKNIPVEISLGTPKAKLYYSEPNIEMDTYGYIWLTLLEMPAFSGLDLKLTWDESTLKSIRVSPEPWLIDHEDFELDSWVVTENRLEINDIAATNPPWRMKLGKWHFKALKPGPTTVTLWQNNQRLDTININIIEQINKNKKENDFDF